MNFIKTAFLISLFNFLFIGLIVLIFNKPKPIDTMPIALPTVVQSPTETIPIVTILAAKPTVDNRCIIVVDGIRFDITKYRYQHSGGDIFQCGTDMSTIFHDRHPNSFLRRISQYQI